ncbi:MAG TPA: hypothetical protein VM889_03265 [Candidatus Thermoplasmatota archaeon]|nr:hypothetical protein [Candidatus Thermoplasmatota archaeon]
MVNVVGRTVGAAGRVLGGLQAFALGRSLGQEIASGRLADEWRRVREHESAWGILGAAGATALTLAAWRKKPEIVALAGAGLLLGTGLLAHAWARVAGEAPAVLRAIPRARAMPEVARRENFTMG